MSSFFLLNLSLSLLLLCFDSSNVVTGTTSFNTESLGFSGFKFLGDAHVLNDNSLSLSQDILSPNSGSGRVFYMKPIRFRQPVSRAPVSFSTNFSLMITSSNKDSRGGGVAFVVSSSDDDDDDDAIGRSGGYLGVPSGAISVEFDTQMDVEFEDINGNHVGLNLGSMISRKVANLDVFNLDLRSGRPVNVWLHYSGADDRLNVYMSYKSTKPRRSVLSVVGFNLNRYVKDFMYVGLSASTQGSTEVHTVQRWSFRSYFDSNPGRTSPPPPTTAVKPAMSPNSQQSKWDYLLGRIIGGVMAAVGVLFAGGVCYYCIRHFHCCHECNNNSLSCCNRRKG